MTPLTSCTHPNPSQQSLASLELRRLFLLAPQDCTEFADPLSVPLGGGWRLTHHRDLQVLQCREGRRTLTLIGHLLDPYQPQADDRLLLETLIRKDVPLDQLPAATAHLGGRWALFGDDGDQALVWTDPAAQRPVYYHRHPEHATQDGGPIRTSLAGEPGLLARHLGLTVDPVAADYAEGRGDSDVEVHWLPGDRTLYTDVRTLLPNHWLDLRSGRCRRWWPQAPIPRLDWDSVLQRCEVLLRGQLEAIQRRWPLALPMTAGWDSRLMLALCRPIASEVHAYTLAYPPQGRRANDVRVPARLLASLGLAHQIVRCPDSVDEGFKALMRRHQPTPARGCCADAQALWRLLPQDRMSLSGDVAEVVKAHFRRPDLRDETLTAADLADLIRIGRHPFALEALQDWLAGARPSPVPLLDLFCWEQMAGRWQAKLRADMDLVQDGIAPLNHRELLVTMLAAAESRRRAPQVELFEALILRMWPQALTEPVNPPERQSTLVVLRALAGRIGLNRLLPVALRRGMRRLIDRED